MLEIVGKVRGVEVSEAAPLKLHSRGQVAATTTPASQLPPSPLKLVTRPWNLEFGCHKLTSLTLPEPPAAIIDS